MFKRIISYFTMKKLFYFTANLGGELWVYVDNYNQYWLSYTDTPKKRTKISYEQMIAYSRRK